MTTAAEPRIALPESESLEHDGRRPIAKALMGGLIALAALGAGFSYLHGRGLETTDDAQIEAHVASVSPRISGQVKRVLVQDHQEVHVGDVLVELDDRDLAVRLLAAQADREAAQATVAAAQAQVGVVEATARSNLKVARSGVDQAAAGAGTARAGIALADADLAAAVSKRELAQSELGRTRALYDQHAISDAELDLRRATFEQAQAVEAQSRARLLSANANVANSDSGIVAARGKLLGAEAGPEQIQAARAQVTLASARLAQAEANVEQAKLNLSYVQVRAEMNGVVARRSVEPGQSVSPERPLLAIVAMAEPWVVASFKEDQIGHMRPGQHARVEIDAFAGQQFHALVTSVSPGTGARFALLPPDNASGNFTKVVQRVPVFLRLDPPPQIAMRPGMSSIVIVQTDR
ncbi:MAG TPA: HlyD family secretion protein [Polyangiaceae bacterium]|nr:HlyD family secretion protein [Polyangiaceae bacterium]